MSNDFEIPPKSVKASSKKPMAEARPEAEPKVETVVPESKKSEYDSAELLRIFDEIIFAGEYIEEVVIRGRLPVKFSTRTAEQVGQIQDALDSAGLTLISSVEQRRTILNLEQALVSFNGKDLSGMMVKEKSKFVNGLAAPVIGMLVDELNKFDLKIAAACREEANF